jgi:hypothetical protein
MKMLMENWRSYKDEQESLLLFERVLNEELDKLISEGVLDMVKGAYEKTKSGALKIKDNLSDAVRSALAKVNDFFLKISVQAMGFAAKSVQGLQKAVSTMMGALGKFKNSHPILFKIGMVLVFMVIMFGIMILTSGDAQAAIDVGGGKSLSKQKYLVMRGVLDTYSQNAGADEVQVLEAVKVLDAAYESGDTEKLKDLGKYSRGAYSYMQKLIDAGKAGDRDAFESLEKFKSLGKRLMVDGSKARI